MITEKPEELQMMIEELDKWERSRGGSKDKPRKNKSIRYSSRVKLNKDKPETNRKGA